MGPPSELSNQPEGRRPDAVDNKRIYLYSDPMATTVHLPPDLLQSVDRQAVGSGLSRNRYIIRALQKALEEETGWSRRLLDTLAEAREDTESHEILDDMMRAIAARQSRKGPPEL